MTLTIRNRLTSAILLLGALAGGCGDDDDDGPGTNLDGGAPMLDANLGGGDGATGGSTTYSGKVVNSTTLEPVSGRTVRLFNPEDLSFYPGLEAVGGNVTFQRPAGAGAFVLGGGDFQDTYGFPPSRVGEEELIRVGTASTATAVPGIAGYTTNQDAAPLAGTILWKNKATGKDEVVGCATIEGDGVNDVRYFVMTLPASLAQRPAALGTQPAKGGTPAMPGNVAEAGRYFTGNILPGKRTLIVKVNGTEIGRTTWLFKARKDASDGSLAGGQKTLLFLGSLYVGENLPSNPTPANCM